MAEIYHQINKTFQSTLYTVIFFFVIAGSCYSAEPQDLDSLLKSKIRISETNKSKLSGLNPTSQIPAPKSKFKNVILFTVDSFRPDHLSCYGYKKNVTPAIDELADNGVVFNLAIAQSAWTTPGMVSIFTSLYPHSHRVNARGESLNNDIIALPKLLKMYGYDTPAFLYLIEDPNYYNLGFDKAPEHIFNGNRIEDLLELIEIYKEKRFFIWHHNKYTHLPYKAPAPYDQLLTQNKEENNPGISSGLYAVKNSVIVKNGTVEFKKGDKQKIEELYDVNIKRLNDHLALLIDRLRKFKILDETLLILTADHGEELLDHGFVGHASTSLSAKLYDEIIHIPLIFYLPKYLPHRKIDEQVQQIDIFPTILDVLDIDIPAALQGRSLIPLFDGGKQVTWPEFALSETNKGGYQSTEEMKQIILTSMRTPVWKLICTKNKREEIYELFSLKKDPDENVNVYKKYPEVVKNLRSMIKQIKGEN